MAKTHDLKCWPDVFRLMCEGKKTFEYRKNDRDYQIGDTLHEREWDPKTEKYSGVTLDVKVTLIIEGGQFEIPSGYCIMQVSLPLESLEAHDEWVRKDEREKMRKAIERLWRACGSIRTVIYGLKEFQKALDGISELLDGLEEV